MDVKNELVCARDILFYGFFIIKMHIKPNAHVFDAISEILKRMYLLS